MSKSKWFWADDGNLYDRADWERAEAERKAGDWANYTPPRAIVTTDSGFYGPVEPERSLIGAVPETLEALENTMHKLNDLLRAISDQGLVRYFIDDSINMPLESISAVEKARAAIAKAKEE